MRREYSAEEIANAAEDIYNILVSKACPPDPRQDLEKLLALYIRPWPGGGWSFYLPNWPDEPHIGIYKIGFGLWGCDERDTAVKIVLKMAGIEEAKP